MALLLGGNSWRKCEKEAVRETTPWQRVLPSPAHFRRTFLSVFCLPSLLRSLAIGSEDVDAIAAAATVTLYSSSLYRRKNQLSDAKELRPEMLEGTGGNISDRRKSPNASWRLPRQFSSAPRPPLAHRISLVGPRRNKANKLNRNNKLAAGGLHHT